MQRELFQLSRENVAITLSLDLISFLRWLLSFLEIINENPMTASAQRIKVRRRNRMLVSLGPLFIEAER